MKRVLFLDDEEAILNTYRRMVRSLDVEAYFAKSTIDAQRIIDRCSLDLIVSDYRLQQETGLEFLRGIRSFNDKVPMVIISGYAEENFIRSAMDQNIIQDYLVKPVSVIDFNKVIDRYLYSEDV